MRIVSNLTRPLYGSLHCYVRGKLQKNYGEQRVPSNKPIPAQLLDNMSAQQWGEIYPLVEPYPDRKHSFAL